MDAGLRDRFVRYLPYDEFKVASGFAPQEIKRRLSKAIEPPKDSRGDNLRGIFQGEVEGDVFRVQRVIGYKNMFLPEAEVVVSPDGAGSTLAVKMKLKPTILAFVVAWLSTAAATVALAFYLMVKAWDFSLLWLAPTLLFLFGYLMCMLGFTVEAVNTKTQLKRLLEG